MGDLILKQLADELRAGSNGEIYTLIDGEFAGEKAYFGEKTIYSKPEFQVFFDDLRKDNPRHGQQIASEAGDVFCEIVKAAPRLCICGGGHVSLELAHIASRLGFAITVIDEDPRFGSRERFPMAKEVYCCSFGDALEKFGGGYNDYFVIVSRGHQYDRFCLEQILHKRYAYVGMIGSRTKTRVLFADMLQHGYTQTQLDEVYTPIGLMIGAETPAEIAVAIAAEIVEVKSAFGTDSVWEPNLLAAVAKMDRPAAMAVIIRREGSTPRGPGARMLVYEDGSIVGTIGGGGSEAEAIRIAQEIIRDETRPGLYHCNMNNDDAQALGLVCGGEIDVFIEQIN